MASNLTRRREGRESQGALGRWEPFRSLREMDPFSLMREMFRFDPFLSSEQWVPPEMAFSPRTDVRERTNAYEVTVELPGVRQEDVEVTCDGNTLTICGERREEAKEEGERYHSWERSYGRFSRSFTLPEGIEQEKVKAELWDGVLRVMIPKKASVQPKRIPVEASQAAPQEQPSQPVKVEKKAA